MKLIRGKFYDDACGVVPLEFGNNEQIKLIEMAKNLKAGGFIAFRVEGDKLIWGFQCPCGGEVILPEGENNLPNDIKCKGCDAVYILSIVDEDVFVKTK